MGRYVPRRHGSGSHCISCRSVCYSVIYRGMVLVVKGNVEVVNLSGDDLRQELGAWHGAASSYVWFQLSCLTTVFK